MKRIPIRFFLSLCLASFVFGALTLSSAVPSAHAQSGPIRVTYVGTKAVDYNYEQCIPISVDGHPADTIDVTTPVFVTSYADPNCHVTPRIIPAHLGPGVYHLSDLEDGKFGFFLRSPQSLDVSQSLSR